MSCRKYFPSSEELQVIQDWYDGSSLRINKIVRLLGPKYPRWYIRRKAGEMGLSHPKISDWSAREEEYLHNNYPRKGMVAIQNGLRRINGGITRSPCAIVLKKKRLHINKRSNGLTMRMMEDLLGVDHHKVEAWMAHGMLQAKRKGTARLDVQGGDMWHFEPRDVRDFVTQNPELIDLRKVEPVTFIHLVAGIME